MNRTALLAAAVVALVGFLLLSVYIRRFQREATGGAPVRVLMVRQDVAVAEPLTAEMLAVRELPSSFVEDRHVISTDLERVLGVKASLDLRANQTLLWTDLETKQREDVSLSNRIPGGMRAMAIPGQQSNGFAGLLQPGNRVDVLLTKIKPGTGGRHVTVPLLQNLLVLAVGDNVRVNHEGSSGGGAVTVLVTIDQAGLLAQAQRDGTLRLVLRNEDDVEINLGLRETDDNDVLEQERRARIQRPRRIERVN